ncbi:nucleotidyltransferase [Spirosoma soli]|uniref:Nucleotidyltransferase n=1 Tax=Spirosoma soli TaxID=1770529 RepID=A0ABW5M4Z4_9BACT
MNIADDDVRLLLESLNRYSVQFLLVGGMAGVIHGHVRTTQDMDLWIKSDEQNKHNLILALKENEVAGADYLKDVPLIFGWSSVSVGKYGFTLDMGYNLKAFRDVDFDVCYKRAIEVTFDGVTFKVIQLNDLITEKLATGRPKDILDIEELNKIKSERGLNDAD